MSSRCVDCSGAIEGEAVLVNGRLHHPQHFRCSTCKLVVQNYYYLDGEQNPTCESCWQRKNPTCKKCRRFVNETFIVAMNQTWHLNCFLCSACGKPFPGGRFVDCHGEPYDLDCFWGLQLRKFNHL
ncbi:hypothetical protein L596_027615 [Steinernema carpocapsae]|uniref:LIM zinc-binding domain-containing protein n=1 Tax=Steinernema carpocapsae TaxID=34508 RepID=A0A4U5LVZ3_STECR|nr:hypothetical protein L596_027615 [Steinernema carpocapsae]